MDNFNKLLERIKALRAHGGRLLDVGCAHGWFLETARKDFDVLGLEPDHNVFAATSRRGLPIREGYFPQALNEAEKFDVIVFNDVLEHIPPVEDLLASCRKYLDDRGLLVVNLPSSDGILYRLAKSLHRMGASSFFDRLWQRGMPSPHVHYFNTSNLTSLLKNNGFDLECSGRLPSVRLNGLYARISYAGKRSVVERMALYAGIAGCLPLFDLLPSDIVYVIAKRS